MNPAKAYRTRGRRSGRSLPCVVGLLAGLFAAGPRISGADDPAVGRAQCRLVIGGEAAGKDGGTLVFLDRPRNAGARNRVR